MENQSIIQYNNNIDDKTRVVSVIADFNESPTKILISVPNTQVALHDPLLNLHILLSGAGLLIKSIPQINSQYKDYELLKIAIGQLTNEFASATDFNDPYIHSSLKK